MPWQPGWQGELYSREAPELPGYVTWWRKAAIGVQQLPWPRTDRCWRSTNHCSARGWQLQVAQSGTQSNLLAWHNGALMLWFAAPNGQNWRIRPLAKPLTSRPGRWMPGMLCSADRGRTSVPRRGASSAAVLASGRRRSVRRLPGDVSRQSPWAPHCAVAQPRLPFRAKAAGAVSGYSRYPLRLQRRHKTLKYGGVFDFHRAPFTTLMAVLSRAQNPDPDPFPAGALLLRLTPSLLRGTKSFRDNNNDGLPDLGLARPTDEGEKHLAEMAKAFGEASMTDNGLTTEEQARLFAFGQGCGERAGQSANRILAPALGQRRC